MMANIYSGAPAHFADLVLEAQSKALEIQIRAAMARLTNGQGDSFSAVVFLLGSLVDEGEWPSA